MTELNEIDQKDLLLQMAAGNEKAFSHLFRLYSDKLYSFIFTISGSKQFAEDTVQEVFLKIWNKRSEAASINHFDSYLFRMAHNHAFNALRRMSKELVFLNEFSHHSPGAQEVSTSLEFKEMELYIKKAVNKLPNKQRQVFILSREHGMKQTEISRLLKITVPTVKSHITQAIHTIRKECRNIYTVIKIFFMLLFQILH